MESRKRKFDRNSTSFFQTTGPRHPRFQLDGIASLKRFLPAYIHRLGLCTANLPRGDKLASRLGNRNSLLGQFEPSRLVRRKHTLVRPILSSESPRVPTIDSAAYRTTCCTQLWRGNRQSIPIHPTTERDSDELDAPSRSPCEGPLRPDGKSEYLAKYERRNGSERYIFRLSSDSIGSDSYQHTGR